MRALRDIAVGGQLLRCAGWPASTTRCSSRCTASTRPVTRSPRSRPWRRSSARTTPGQRRLVRGPSPGSARRAAEVVRRSPTVVLDAAHNPHGAQATADSSVRPFAFSPLVGVLGDGGQGRDGSWRRSSRSWTSVVDPELDPDGCRGLAAGPRRCSARTGCGRAAARRRDRRAVAAGRGGARSAVAAFWSPVR